MKFRAIQLSSLLILGIIFTYTTVTAQDKDVETVKSILLRQASDWNKGDLEAFMVGYWESDQLKFMGKSGITYGYEATLARYKKNYPDTVVMGKLSFDIISTEKIDKKIILMTGKFHLKRTIGDAEGYFSLIWKKIDREWLVICDHTSG